MARNALQALLLGATLGFIVALAPSCGGPVQQGRCSIRTCSGCCGTDGQCYTGNSNTACGTGALTCQSCAANEACTDGQCRIQTGGTGGGGGSGGTGGGNAACGPSTCTGCCNLAGTCITGNTTASCGKGGGSCSTCQGGQTCQGGACTSAVCGGCLDISNNCQAGDNDMACGSDGGVCVACGTGETCSAGKCQSTTGNCGPSNCAGCCSNTGCIDPPTNAQCGAGGAACVSCQGAQTCSSGQCVGGGGTGGGGGFPGLDSGFPSFDAGFGTCGPGSCAGCCFTGICVPIGFGQVALNQCGTGGAACITCPVACGSTGVCM